MYRMRRFMRLPADWEDLAEEELERLYDRADRMQGILPELPPLDQRADTDRRRASSVEDEEGLEKRFERKRRSNGSDRETMLDLQDERGD